MQGVAAGHSSLTIGGSDDPNAFIASLPGIVLPAADKPAASTEVKKAAPAVSLSVASIAPCLRQV